MWKTIRLILGVILLAAGLVGMLLPIIPGIPLLLAGAALLGSNHPWVRPFMSRLRWWRQKRKRSR